MWSNGVDAVCILVTRVVSFTLVNVHKLSDRNNGTKIMQKKKLIILVNSNLKAFQTVDCTCTILSISDKSRFTSAHIWSTCIIIRSLLVASARACAALINIYHKIRKKEIKKKMNKISAKDISILISIKEPWDPGSSQKTSISSKLSVMGASLVEPFN